MIAKALTPILNVSNFLESVAWFEKLGWTKGFQWGTASDLRGRLLRRVRDLPRAWELRAAVGTAVL